MPSTPKAMYEAEWLEATVFDLLESKPERYAIMKDDATPEQQQTALEIFNKFLDKVDAHFADGRAHVAGEQITWADFMLLALNVSMYENPNGKQALLRKLSQSPLLTTTWPCHLKS